MNIRSVSDQDHTWSKRLLDSDATYFRLAAESRDHWGATLYFMPRFRQIPAACVAVSTTNPTTGVSFPTWTERLEGLVMAQGFYLARIYVIEGSDMDESFERTRTYSRRLEVGYHSGGSPPRSQTAVSLAKISTRGQWAAKESIHRSAGLQPDGYEVPAGDWVDLERAKSQDGQMIPYLGLIDGVPAATICTIQDGSYLRLKNLVVHPDFRRRGLATQIVHSLWAIALRRGLSGVLALAIAGSSAESLYQHASLQRNGRLAEWTRRLPGD